MRISFKFLISIFCVLVFSSQVYSESQDEAIDEDKVLGYDDALNLFPEAEGDLKIGVVQALKVLKQSPQYQASVKRIDKEFESRSKVLIGKQKKIKDLEDKLNKDRAIMSESEISKLERDVLAKRRDYKRSQDEYGEDLNFRRTEESAKIRKEIVEAIQKVAKDNGYDVVLNEGFIYLNPDSQADITNLVIELLNK